MEIQNLKSFLENCSMFLETYNQKHLDNFFMVCMKKLNFGKYKNQTFIDVLINHNDYIDFLIEKSTILLDNDLNDYKLIKKIISIHK